MASSISPQRARGDPTGLSAWTATPDQYPAPAEFRLIFLLLCGPLMSDNKAMSQNQAYVIPDEEFHLFYFIELLTDLSHFIFSIKTISAGIM